nr:hypothetical protein [Gloeomargarita lithophora]
MDAMVTGDEGYFEMQCGCGNNSVRHFGDGSTIDLTDGEANCLVEGHYHYTAIGLIDGFGQSFQNYRREPPSLYQKANFNG